MSLVMLLSADVYELINYISSILWLSVVASVAGMLWLRKTRYLSIILLYWVVRIIKLSNFPSDRKFLDRFAFIQLCL